MKIATRREADARRKQWKTIEGLLSQLQQNDRHSRSKFLREMGKLEPLVPYNRLIAVQALEYEAPMVALKLLDRAACRGEAHAMYDYHRARTLWLLRKPILALSEAKKAARRWNSSCSFNALSQMYGCWGRMDLFNKWFEKARKRADEELADDKLLQVHPSDNPVAKKLKRVLAHAARLRGKAGASNLH